MIRTHDTLKGGAVARLRVARAMAEKTAKLYCVDRSWREHTRPLTPSPKITKRGALWFADTLEDLGRVAWLQNDKGIGRERTTGYYVSEDGDRGTVYGAVVLINLGRRGVAVIAATVEDDSDGVTFYPYTLSIVKGDTEDAISECARQADQEASAEGERLRTYNQQFDTEQTIERERESIRDNKKTLWALGCSLRDLTLPEPICEAVRRDVARVKAAIGASYDVIQRARADLVYLNREIARYEAQRRELCEGVTV